MFDCISVVNMSGYLVLTTEIVVVAYQNVTYIFDIIYLIVLF